MADPGRTDPFADIISLVAGPIAAVVRSFDQLRRGADELMKGFENFNATMANLNETAQRVNRLLNDIEEPVRAMLPQVTRTVKLADDISKRLQAPLEKVIPGLDRLAEHARQPGAAQPPDRPRAVLGGHQRPGPSGCRRSPRSPSRPARCSGSGSPGSRHRPPPSSAPTPRTEPPIPATSATTATRSRQEGAGEEEGGRQAPGGAEALNVSA